VVRRATAALLGTVAGTALLVGAKYAAPPSAGAGSAIGGDVGETGVDPGTSASVDPSADSGAPSSGNPSNPGPAPSAGPTSTKASPGGKTTAPTATRTTAPVACKTVSGVGTTVVSPGEGTMVVTIKFCNGAITTSTGSLSKSNWNANTAAITEFNKQALQCTKTNLSPLSFSGATLTRNAYRTSLANALTKVP
jgi:hypothetical protein